MKMNFAEPGSTLKRYYSNGSTGSANPFKILATLIACMVVRTLHDIQNYDFEKYDE